MFFENWNIILLFAITLVSVVSFMTINGGYVKKYTMKNSEHHLKSACYSVVSALTLILLSSFSIKLSIYSLLLGMVFGVATSLYQAFISLAIKAGPYGYSYVIMYFSTVITSLSGFVFWGEDLSWLKIVGIAFMLACFYFAVENKSDDKKANGKWFVLSLVSMIAVAAIGLLQKVHQSSDYKSELMGFLFVSFAFSAIISFLTFLFVRGKEKRVDSTKLFESKQKINTLLITVVLCGVFTSFNNVLNLFLAGKVETAIFFPIVNGVPLIASLLVSLFLFKEKMSKRQWAGILFGVLGLSCLFIN